ncbi:MAG: M56 family metallopeptidase [Lachnospiraceae bacterium]|nr:M56 family metallopeptidase [Lachnospiraceae bacterium]
MQIIFLQLLNMGITASWIILAVTVLRLFMKKAPKWITCALWALVAIRLSCPFTLESAFSLIPRAETINLIDNPYPQNPTFYSGVSSYMDSSFTDISFANSTSASTYGANPLHTLLPIASLIWICGLCIMMGYTLISFIRMHRSVQEAVPLRAQIWICDAVQSPFILGLFRPRIYLPSDLEQEQVPYVLAHEQAHLKRHDHLWKLLGYMLLTVYWFHPLVWLAYILFCRDIELACDEKVIKDMDIIGKKAYSSALVCCSIPRQVIAVSPLAFGEVGAKERVKTILNYKKPAFWIVIAAVISCIVVAVCFLTNPRTDVFDVKIVVPAGSIQPFHYSDMEISPTKNQIVLSSGDGLGDTLVTLKPIEVTEENAYEPTYMTPGLPVKMYAEKGAWFKIGVDISNPTDENIIVYVHVENAIVRVADSDAIGKIQYLDQWYDKEALSDETITWLEWYNSLPEEEQLMVDSVPSDLYELTEHNSSSDIAADAEWDMQPMIMVNNTYYYDTNQESTRSDRSDNIDGIITSTVEGWEIPQENDQSNFGTGFRYQIINDDILEVNLNGNWIIYEAHKKDMTDTPENNTEEPDLNTAITAAILERNASSYPYHSDFTRCDFVPLATVSATPVAEDTVHMTTCYGWALYQEYNVSDTGLENLSGSHVPVALTFTLDENGYQLIEYWEPRDGSYYVTDIREKFPSDVVADALDSQKYIVRQTQSCYKQVIEATGLDTDTIIENLLDTLCSNPNESSSPQDYIDADPITYRELIYYGEYTLHYCLNRFLNGNETGLEGKIMAMVCETLLQTKGQLPLDAEDAATGQLWYEKLLAYDKIITQNFN